MNNGQNPFLSGDYAPVHDELVVSDLRVKGKIPEDLKGIYMRNGPNPEFQPISYTYPFDGDGMIHAVYIKDGKASYRNRFVETRGLKVERRAGRAVYGGLMNPMPLDPNLIGPDGDPGPIKNGAFIHIIRHAGHYLAMSEGDPAYEMTAELTTLGEYCPNRKQPLGLGPHTRLDPATGELFLICYQLTPPYLIHYKIDPQGNLVKTVPIEKPYATMMHDFVLTQNYIVFVDCPAVFDINAMATGGDLLAWRPELGTRVGILPRDGSSEDIKWFEIDPFFVFHFANAYESENKIIIDYVHHDNLNFASKMKPSSWPKLYKITIDLKTNKINNENRDENAIEFPRINESYNSLSNQYVYAPAKPQSNNIDKFYPYSVLIKYDATTDNKEIHDFGKDYEIDEAVFAPRLNSKSEDDGYVMLFVYDRNNNNSQFVILDAKDFAGEPVAAIQLPRRVPHGLHGSWMPGDW